MLVSPYFRKSPFPQNLGSGGGGWLELFEINQFPSDLWSVERDYTPPPCIQVDRQAGKMINLSRLNNASYARLSDWR